MKIDKKLLVLAGLMVVGVTSLLADTLIIYSSSNQYQSVQFTVPSTADIDIYGCAYGEGSYISGSSPLGSFYHSTADGWLDIDGTVPAGTYTIVEDVGYSGYICGIINWTAPYTISSTTVASSPSNQQRTKLGVGETVFVTLSPAPYSTSWTSTAGDETLTNKTPGQVKFAAPAMAGDVTIKATTSDGYEYTRTFQVVAPSDIYMERDPAPGIYHNQGEPSAGMLCRVFVLPNDVNFSAINIREEASPAGQPAVATGLFYPLNGTPHMQQPWFIMHEHTAGKGTWDNGATAWDQVTITAVGYTPAPGTFVWTMPWSYKLKNSDTVYFGYVTKTQNAISYSSGTVSLSKASAFLSTELNDPEGAWYP